jgi:cell division control protein 45
MYLPRDLIAHLYEHLVQSNRPQSPAVLLLVALEPDALCACRILTALLKRDYISHTILPVSGYADLARVGETHVQPLRKQQGGGGGTVICLGVGGLVDLSAVLGLEATDEDQDPTGGVEIWVIDARRPWNLGNVFGGQPPDSALAEVNGNARARAPEVSFGQIQPNYRPGKGGIIVFDDGDIGEELAAEREAYFRLEGMPPIDDDGHESDDSDSESDGDQPRDDPLGGQKRKSWSDRNDEEEDENEDSRPSRRRRSNSGDSIPVSPNRRSRPSPPPYGIPLSRSPSPPGHAPPSGQGKPPSARRNRRRLLRLKRENEAILHAYYSLGTSYSEPISNMVYSLASELGREDNDLLWHAIVGVSSLELYGRSVTGVGITRSSGSGGSAGRGGEPGEAIRRNLQDEVRRLNPPDPKDASGEGERGETSGVIPTTARSPEDDSIKLSPEPRFLLIRHWSLYESMLPFLAARLHIWHDVGRKRLHKLLAKMGISLQQSKQNYTHMDMDLKKGLRRGLLKYATMYGLDGLVPPAGPGQGREGWGFVRSWGWEACLSAVDVGVIVGAMLEVGRSGTHLASDGNSSQSEVRGPVDEDGRLEGEEHVVRFWDAYDALGKYASIT